MIHLYPLLSAEQQGNIFTEEYFKEYY